MILGIFIIPTLAISLAIPAKEIGMADGILVAFQIFFQQFQMPWLSNILALMIVLGALAAVVTWVAGPSKGLFMAAKTGLLPPTFQKANKHNVQVGILVPQGIIVSLLASIFIFVPNVSDVFMALIDMSAALYIIMYLMMFVAAMLLRKTDPNTPRGFRLPALNFVAIVGFVSCFLGLIMSFIPTSGESAIPVNIYPLVVLAVVLVLGVPPFIFYALKKPNWKVSG
jgi:amino acid transporter